MSDYTYSMGEYTSEVQFLAAFMEKFYPEEGKKITLIQILEFCNDYENGNL